MVGRRTVLAGATLGGLAACALKGQTNVNALPDKRQTFVLVHGTWHGGWVWKYVRNILEDAGHRVFTPTLTGCGERVHLSSPDVGLDTHIKDIINVIEFEDLTDVFLVGHSFTGVAITGVADRLKDRIKHICFFDALVPFGDRMSGAPRKPDGSLADYFVKRQSSFIDGYKMDLFADYPLKMLLPEDHSKADWVRSKITTHPAKTWMDVLTLKNGGWSDVPRSFIHCVGQKFAMSSEKMVGPARQPGWQFIELDIYRDGMVTHPELVAKTFLKLAEA
ncbi:alpha/beta fold hydrolase [Fretibacter rubidus]|uniref:alpha/beta fold hydrolase n=1 Tax=Fretibacter rubidus TaxID=570162 RepID=UPI00352AFED8